MLWSIHSGILLLWLVSFCNILLLACHQLTVTFKINTDRVRRSRVPYIFIRLGELVYSVVWGTLLTECVWEKTCHLSEEEADRKTPKMPPVKIVSGDWSTTDMYIRPVAFLCCTKFISNNNQRQYARAVNLLKSDTVKSKFQSDGNEGKEDEEQPKQTAWSFSVRFLFTSACRECVFILKDRVTWDVKVNKAKYCNWKKGVFHQENGFAILMLFKKAFRNVSAAWNVLLCRSMHTNIFYHTKFYHTNIFYQTQTVLRDLLNDAMSSIFRPPSG